ncbi:hypothetical protein [Streptomyces sp. 142MFCol3.1]|uniref:hypothetical protein n=1 Tax=Streptomyces sp. 142MFCol3.1 TaxID=1172179 RepID=UPI0004156FE3|nr:hypothetical protein [Streptomyces sp. 142MFCol3.1]
MSSQSAATLRTRYEEQAASDLEENRRRQRELIDALEVLKQEETLLLDILKVAERFDVRVPQQATDEPAAVTEPQDEPAAEAPEALGPEVETPEADAAPAPPTKASKRPGRSRAATPRPSKKTAKAVTKAQPQQSLGEVLLGLLRTHDEPRPAKELREELLRKHTDRTPTPQVVRNTLEALVAKGRIQRHKRERSVMYTFAEGKGQQATAPDVGTPETEG